MSKSCSNNYGSIESINKKSYISTTIKKSKKCIINELLNKPNKIIKYQQRIKSSILKTFLRNSNHWVNYFRKFYNLSINCVTLHNFTVFQSSISFYVSNQNYLRRFYSKYYEQLKSCMLNNTQSLQTFKIKIVIDIYFIYEKMFFQSSKYLNFIYYKIQSCVNV